MIRLPFFNVRFQCFNNTFQFFKIFIPIFPMCQHVFPSGSCYRPTKVLVEALDDVSIPIPVFPNKTSCEWFNVCMIMKREIAPLKQFLFYWVYLKALLQTHLIQCSNWEVSINAHEWRNQIFLALHVICLSIIC